MKKFIDTGPVEERFMDTGPVEKLVTPEMIIEGLSAEDTGITIASTGDPITNMIQQKAIFESLRSAGRRHRQNENNKE